MRCGDREQQGRRNELDAEGQDQADGAGLAHAMGVAAPARMADAHGRCHGDAERDHERHRGDIDRDLVAGDDVGAELADGQGDGDEQARFHEQGDRDRHADVHQLADRAPVRCVKSFEQAQLAIASAPRQIDGEGQALQPEHDRRGQAATAGAQRGHAECAVHEGVADRAEQGQPEQTEIHGRPGQAHAFTEPAQDEEDRQCRRAPGDRAQKGAGIGDEARIDADQAEQAAGPEMPSPGRGRYRAAAASHSAWRNSGPISCVAAGAAQLGDRGLQRHHHADDDDDREHPDIAAERDRAERVRIQMAGQHGIDQVHADRGELTEDQRQGQAHGGVEFAGQAGPVGG